MGTESGGSRAGMSTRALLGCGIAAGPLYLTVALVQILTRDGFDMRRHAVSLLSNGDMGWVQISSFMLSGVLVIAGALGARRLLHGRRGGTWGPILLAIYGVGLIGAGLFVADPAQGFPPGTPLEATEMSRNGLLHFIFGGIGFYALIAACFVFARRFAGLGQGVWATYSGFTGIAFFSAFAAIASGSTSSVTILAFYAAVAWVWVWHAALSATLFGEVRAAPSSGSAVPPDLATVSTRSSATQPSRDPPGSDLPDQ